MVSSRTSSLWKVSSLLEPVWGCQMQFAHQPDGLFDHDRTSAGHQSSPTRTSTSGRSPGG